MFLSQAVVIPKSFDIFGFADVSVVGGIFVFKSVDVDLRDLLEEFFTFLNGCFIDAEVTGKNAMGIAVLFPCLFEI